MHDIPSSGTHVSMSFPLHPAGKPGGIWMSEGETCDFEQNVISKNDTMCRKKVNGGLGLPLAFFHPSRQTAGKCYTHCGY
jgi:hypothetical protein